MFRTVYDDLLLLILGLFVSVYGTRTDDQTSQTLAKPKPDGGKHQSSFQHLRTCVNQLG